LLLTVGIEPADGDAINEPAIELPEGFGPQLVQFIVDLGLFDKADLTPPARIGKQHVGRIGVIEQAFDGVLAVRQEVERQRVRRAAAAGAGASIGFKIDVVAIERRIAVIDHKAEVVGRLPFKVGADRENFGLRTFGVSAQDREDVGEGCRVGKRAAAGHAFNHRAAIGAPCRNRGFGTAENARIVGVGVEAVDREREPVGRFKLQRAGDRRAFKLAAHRTLTRVIARENHAFGGAFGLELVGLEFARNKLGRD